MSGLKKGQAFLHNTHISPYPFAHQFNHEPERVRKLLLHKREIRRLTGKTHERGYTAGSVENVPEAW